MARKSPMSALVASAALCLTHNAFAQTGEPAPQPAPGETEPGTAAPAEPVAPATGTAPAAAQPQPAAPPTAPPPTAPSPRAPVPVAPPPVATGPAFPSPDEDEDTLLLSSGEEGDSPDTTAMDSAPTAKKWWSDMSPTVTLHGYFRNRLYLWHNFALGRLDPPGTGLFSQPADKFYSDGTSHYGPELCTADNSSDDFQGQTGDNLPCDNNNNVGANIRLRLQPEIHLSDNLRIRTEIAILDNIQLGQTPEGYTLDTNTPSARPRGGYSPLSAFAATTQPPVSGINAIQDSITVKRAWAEYTTPVGVLRFGRMPSNWGLGVLANDGNGWDDDYQTTADRVMFVTGVPSIDLYFAAGLDFPGEGPSAISLNQPQLQAYDVAELDDVDQYVFALARRIRDMDQQRRMLANGDVVVNGGIYLVYRSQNLADDRAGEATTGAWVPGLTLAPQLSPTDDPSPYMRRGATAWIPDLWVQILYKGFRFEAEGVTIQGSIDNAGKPDQKVLNYDLSQWGVATEIEQTLMEKRLRLQFGFGWASGDPDVTGNPASPLGGSGGLTPPPDGLQPQQGDSTISTFRFNPSYLVDLIFFRHILTRVQGAYYFRPAVDYDFIRSETGRKIGAGAAVIWSRASEFIQTPGHASDLGVELDLSLYIQESTFGKLSDDPQEMGGFFGLAQFGVFFPLAGLGYQQQVAQELVNNLGPGADELDTAWMLRAYLGVFF